MTLLMRDQENIEKGNEKGIEEGIEKGIEKEEIRTIIRLYHNGFTPNQITDLLGKDIMKVKTIIEKEINSSLS